MEATGWAINPDEEFEYVPECDRKKDADKQVIFLLRPLSAEAYYRAQNNAYEQRTSGRRRAETRATVKTGDIEQNRLLNGICGVKNFTVRSNGSVRPVEWPGRDASLEKKLHFLSFIPAPIRTELAEAIAGETELGKDAVSE